MIPTLPLPQPNPTTSSVDIVGSGQPIPPIERIRLFSNSQWEDFVLEWADSLRGKYARVERCGGAGDMGRDVVAFVSLDEKGQWDNYQCKHYDHPLRPSDIWLELGKLVYYTYIKAFSYPRKYNFVAPQGAGTKLANLFRDSNKLRELLLKNWDQYCTQEITKIKKIPLNKGLKEYIEGLDFSTIGYIPPLRIIDQHASTRWYVSRFGGGLPARPTNIFPPDTPVPEELGYLSKLMDAYSDHLNRDVFSLSDIDNELDLQEHCIDSRIQFYSAESLRSFSRDYLPLGEFKKLQDEIYDGIRDEIRDEHSSGYRRVLSVVKTARNLQLTSHALISKLTVRDRGGICHQLANDREEVRWVKK